MEFSKAIDFMKENKQCWFCQEKFNKVGWGIQRFKRKTIEGCYCTYDCAFYDAWGPRYNRCRIMRIPKKKA